MARPRSTEPTDRELEILHVLWDAGESTLGTVREALQEERPLATTTVATMLRVMLDKRLVRRKKGPRGYLWSAAVSREVATRGMVSRLVDRVFDGSAGRLVTHVVEAGQLDDADLVELRRLLGENLSDGTTNGEEP